VVGVLLVKELLQHWGANSQPLVKEVLLRPLLRVPAELPLYDVLNIFQTGRSHMALVVRGLLHLLHLLLHPSRWRQQQQQPPAPWAAASRATPPLATFRVWSSGWLCGAPHLGAMMRLGPIRSCLGPSPAAVAAAAAAMLASSPACDPTACSMTAAPAPAPAPLPGGHLRPDALAGRCKRGCGGCGCRCSQWPAGPQRRCSSCCCLLRACSHCSWQQERPWRSTRAGARGHRPPGTGKPVAGCARGGGQG
jgi:hypothetical protein